MQARRATRIGRDRASRDVAEDAETPPLAGESREPGSCKTLKGSVPAFASSCDVEICAPCGKSPIAWGIERPTSRLPPPPIGLIATQRLRAIGTDDAPSLEGRENVLASCLALQRAITETRV